MLWSFGNLFNYRIIFLGIKMSESIAHGDIKMFFALYDYTGAIFNSKFIYFYNRTLKKRGKGFKRITRKSW